LTAAAEVGNCSVRHAWCYPEHLLSFTAEPFRAPRALPPVKTR